MKYKNLSLLILTLSFVNTFNNFGLQAVENLRYAITSEFRTEVKELFYAKDNFSEEIKNQAWTQAWKDSHDWRVNSSTAHQINIDRLRNAGINGRKEAVKKQEFRLIKYMKIVQFFIVLAPSILGAIFWDISFQNDKEYQIKRAKKQLKAAKIEVSDSHYAVKLKLQYFKNRTLNVIPWAVIALIPTVIFFNKEHLNAFS